VSRVWNALKEAERERAHVTQQNPDKPCEKPSERDFIERREGPHRAQRVPLLVYGWAQKSSRSTKRPRHLKSTRTGLCCGWRPGSRAANGCS
jgi:hypothetical protein